jgi:hypothetical protein
MDDALASMAVALFVPMGVATSAHVVGGLLIFLLREHHTDVWKGLGRPSVVSVWRLFGYFAGRRYRALPDGPVRTVAKLASLLNWLSIGLIAFYVVPWLYWYSQSLTA